jgi:predicted nucleotidyltransferase
MYSTVGFPIEIDLFVREPFNFDELWEKRMDTIADGVTIHVIDKDSLIALKTLSGRSKDIEDNKDSSE